MIANISISQAMIQGAIDVYASLKEELLPTPASPHYTFSLHDMAHLFNGIMIMSPKPRPRLIKDANSPHSPSISGSK